MIRTGMARAIPVAVAVVIGVGIGAGAAFAQSAAAPLSFEVASIKPSAPQAPGRVSIRLSTDPGRLNYTNVSIKDLIRQAYEVKDFQISGPDWMGSTRFDVVAKLPADTPRSKVPEMLQSLLAERFKLSIRRETKELPMYALVVGKNGLKMKESPKESDPNAPPPGSGPGPGRPGRGQSVMMNGRGHVSAKMMSMGALCDMLARQLDRPVVDETGLQGNYDFDLDYTPDEGQSMLPAGAPPPPPAPGGGAGPGAGGAEPHAPSARDPEANGVSLFNAVQSQLGLKLNAKKGPVELIVVERVEKVPTEN